MKNRLKNLILIILIIAVSVGIGFLVFRAGKSINYNKNAKNPILTLEIEGYGNVEIELEPDYAPNTVSTIVKLAQNGYYDGKVFYGTDSSVVAAGMQVKNEKVSSDTKTDGEENNTESEEAPVTKKLEEDKLRVSDLDKSVTPFVSEDDENYNDTKKNGNEETDYKISIDGEFVANGFNDNTIRFEKGTVGFYRENYNGENLGQESYNSGTSLFFITTKEDSSLNGEYAAFGKVISGMDIIEKMLSLPLEQQTTDENGNSTSDTSAGSLENNKVITKFDVNSCPVIKKATVETYGINYEIPKYSKAFDYDKYLSDLFLQYYQNQ